MLYEKKMLILSGDGKGVVLVEKSAQGVKFTLRTFDMPHCSPLKAGIVTPSAVFVRDLPAKDNPAAVFTLESAELDALHFAVFDDVLRLYGCTCKRMWESNLMDLLTKHERRAPMLDGVPRSPLPPIAKQPQVLPMPDGSGIPQSRLAVYGDDALADNDFYSRVDFSQRMPTVDGFLDTPRVLDELAPRITPTRHAGELTHAELKVEDDAEQTVMHAEPEIHGELTVAEDEEITDNADEPTASSAETDEDVSDNATTAAQNNVDNTAPETPAESETPDAPNSDDMGGTVDTREENTATENETTGAERVVASEAAATEDDAVYTAIDGADAEMPWEATARWIKKRSGRELSVKRSRVRALPSVEKLKRLRATDFFERARRDIDILFASAQRDETLTGLIDDVEWVKVDVEGNTVSVGRSGKAFLCYAVAGTYERTPPLGDEAQWLPRDRTAPTGKGYWVIFQNLVTGEIIKG